MTTPENGVRLDNLLICREFSKSTKLKIRSNAPISPPQKNKNQPKPFLPSPQNICIAAQGHGTATKTCSTPAGGAPETLGAHICSPLLPPNQLREQGRVVSISQTGKLRLRKVRDLDLGNKRGARIRIQTLPDDRTDPAFFLPGESLWAGERHHLRPGPRCQAPGLVRSSLRARMRRVGPARNAETGGPCSSSSPPSTRFPSGLSPLGPAGGSFAEFCVWGQVRPLSVCKVIGQEYRKLQGLCTFYPFHLGVVPQVITW